MTVAVRRERGRTARGRVKRRALAEWTLGSGSRDPLGLLLGQEASRVPELLPLRHQRMSADPFAFYRGSAVIMAADLAAQPDSGLIVQLCGDAHLANFGLYAAPDRVPVFDINDFDETCSGPFEWDVKRLATSFVLLAQQNGRPESEARAAARSVGGAYRVSMTRFARMPAIDVWYDRVSAFDLTQWAEQGKTSRGRRDMTKIIDKARSRDAWSAIRSMTEVVEGERRFVDRPPIVVRVPPESITRRAFDDILHRYREAASPDRARLLGRYEVLDWGHKIVGVGSVGLLAFVCLLRGRDDRDLMALQFKQAQQSVLEPYVGASHFPQHGQRVVEGQRIIQAASDSFLGWQKGELGREYYIRQLRDMKWSPNPAKMAGDAMVAYALLCGHVLARAHARSGDAVALAAYLGRAETFDQAIEESAVGYAEVVRGDYELFQQAITSGRIECGDGPSDSSALQKYMNDPSQLG